MEMNQLSEAEFLAQVGEFGRQEVVRLAEWLMTTEDDREPRELELVCRYAPSIITRSEVEVFGLADPRFAIRLYLESDSGVSLINLRRIERMRAVNPHWGRRMTWARAFTREPLEMLPTPEERPREMLRRASRIADCLLQPPPRLRKNLGNSWHILRVDLGREYGETLETGKFIGTPYLKHIPLAGGGLCAQAVCFMATALLYEHARAVHGLLEVTALAEREFLQKAERDGFEVYEMQLSGLNYGGLTRYFREAGLRAVKQMPKTLSYAEPTANFTNRHDCFTAAANAYLRSGMPIVLTVDLGRLAAPADREAQLKSGLIKVVERPIYAGNGWVHPGFETAQPGQLAKRRDHAVLLVGCDPSAPGGSFLVNDPAALPFLQASTRQLAEAGYYASRFSGIGDRTDNPEELRSLYCLPVTPAAVKMPLLWWLPEEEVDAEDDRHQIHVEHWRDGLFGIASVLFSGAVTLGKTKLPCIPPAERYRDFRLVRLRDLVRVCAEFLQGEDDLPDIAALREELLVRFEWPLHHWAWAQFAREPLSLWIYDAELELPSLDEERGPDAQRGFFRIGVWKQDREWQQAIAPKTRRPDPVPAPNGRHPNGEDGPPVFPSEPAYRFSVLNSCSLQGLEPSLRALRDKTPLVEIQLFSHAEAGRLDAAKLEEWTEAAGVDVSSLAADLPGLGSPLIHESRDAVEALGKVTRAAGWLKANTVRLSTGSRLRGIWPARLRESGGQVYVANVMSRPALSRILLENLRKATDGMPHDSPVRFAIDLEPGELNVLNDWDALAWFALELENPRWPLAVRKRTGFNLDVAHWALQAGIPAGPLISPHQIGGLVRKRIFHATLSDHAKGHFGEQPPGTLHGREVFAVWMRLLQALTEDAENGFSGVVTLKLEGCKTDELLVESLRICRAFSGSS